MWDHFKNFFKILTRESRCALCHIPFIPLQSQPSMHTANWLCERCIHILQPRRGGYCPCCGQITSQEDSPIVLCDQCIKRPPVWNQFRFLAAYTGEYKKLLIQAKFKGDLRILRLLGKLLALHCLTIPRPDVIIPIPLHPSRLHKRGFNQCQEIARPISKLLDVPIQHNLLIRSLPTRHQTGLSKAQRLLNIKDAFKTNSKVKGMRILLVDDIMTTGTTLEQAVKTLLKYKARTVDICVVARTPSLIQEKHH